MLPPDAVDPARARDFGGASASRSLAKSYDVACEGAGLVARVVLARVDSFGREDPATGRSRLPFLSGDFVRAERRLAMPGLIANVLAGGTGTSAGAAGGASVGLVERNRVGKPEVRGLSTTCRGAALGRRR